jgi:hypothetical protein
VSPPEAALFHGLFGALPAESRPDQPSVHDKYGLKHGSASQLLAMAILYTPSPRRTGAVNITAQTSNLIVILWKDNIK